MTPENGNKIGIRVGKKATLAAGTVLVAGAMFGVAKHPDQAAELSRSVIGVERTLDFERIYFGARDIVDRQKYRLVGGQGNPFVEDQQEEVFTAPTPIEISPTNSETPPLEVPKPTPLILPETKQLLSDLKPGEGVWTTEGLPHTSPEDILMAKTFIRPDANRDASVGVLLIDKRRIKLHITGGTESPGGYRGVPGPGKIPESDLPNLLVAWNGGWQGTHADFGMYADGKEYKPLRSGLASVVVMQDGTIKMGEWGRDFTERTDDMVAIRQSAVLLVDNGEVSERTGEGNDTWGYVMPNSRENITWRSAIGLTKNGDLLVAAGEKVNAATLALALQAAGAERAMNLDNNTPYVLTILAFEQSDGSLKTAPFMDKMFDRNNTGRYFKPYKYDFMYATLDETNYRP